MKNLIEFKGLNLKLERQQASDFDWVFGGLSQPCIASIPVLERIKYLPKGEVQRGAEDFMDCATRGPINILEIKFNYLLRNKLFTSENEKWLRDNGYIEGDSITFSDRFIAIKSGTSKQGNSIKAPLEAIRKCGLIPKKMLQADPTMTFDQYCNSNAITKGMETLGKELVERFPINYEKVLEIHYEEACKEDPLNVAGYAWPVPKDGIYPKTIGEPNHVWVNLFPKYTAFDNYLDEDGDFIKQLAPDYDFYEYGYRLFISAQNNITERNSKIMQILKLIGEALGLIKKQVEQLPTNEPTMQEKFLKVCLEALDTDPTPFDEVKDDVSCAFTLSTLIKKVFPDFPILESTKDLDTKLFADKRFKRITEPKRGAIVMSPRKGGTLGHCGVFTTAERIANNNSKNGLWQATYDWQGWIKAFKDKKGLNIYLYEIIN